MTFRRSSRATPAGGHHQAIRLVRKLLLLESAMYSVITPMLPHYAQSLPATKAQLGVLAASYTAGLIPGSILGGWMAVRFGVRRTTLTGVLVFAVALLAFGFVSHLPALDALRAVQGIACGCIWGGALTWVIAVAPEGRRGEMLGTAISAAIVGMLIGPVLGVAAVTIGPEIVFTLAAAVSLLAAVMVARSDEPELHRETSEAPIWTLIKSRRAVIGVWLTMLEAIAWGALSVLIPLRLAHLGASSVEVGATFLLACVLSMFVAPAVGRLCDRSGPVRPVTFALLGTAAMMAILPLPHAALALALVSIVLMGIPLSAFLIPAVSLLTDSTQAAGIALAVSTMLFNLSYALGETIGAPASAVLAQATNEATPFLVLAVLMLLTVAPIVRYRRRLAAGATASTVPATDEVIATPAAVTADALPGLSAASRPDRLRADRSKPAAASGRRRVRRAQAVNTRCSVSVPDQEPSIVHDSSTSGADT